MVFANVVGLLVFLRGRTDNLLAAIVDPLHPDWSGMERAFSGFALYAVSLLGALVLCAALGLRAIVRRRRSAPSPAITRSWRHALPTFALAGALTGAVVLIFIEVLLFQDYGIHFYEFDVFGILADAALRRDLGIQPAEVLRVTTAAVALLGAELLLCVVALRLARWRDGALARACAAAIVVGIPGGLMLFRTGENDITVDRAEFEGALPLGRQLLLRPTTRPFIAVEPRLGPGGYPVLDRASPAPTLTKKSNVVFFVADGLRADMLKPELTPNLSRFGLRSDVIHSARHVSTGHVSEAGIFGLTYGVQGQAYHAFVQQRVAPYPIEVLKRNGYHTFLIASSRLSPYPTDQLVRAFDDVSYPLNDDEAMRVLAQYVDARRRDGKPYFVLSFIYTPHYPFTSAKPQFRKYPLVGPKARSNYMNDVLQSDDYFRQTLDLVRGDFEAGRTIVLATSDHGEEIRDHGVFGHASATFWNEKILVPFFLGLPGASLSTATRSPALSNHTDVWPTIFEYLGTTPTLDPSRFSDGRSLLRPPPSPPPHAYVAGRFFPYADKPSVLVDESKKYWFRVTGLAGDAKLCVVITRVTDLDDRPVSAAPVDPNAIPAFVQLQSEFWRFVTPTLPVSKASRETCD